MKNIKETRILAITLTIVMMMSMILVFTVSGSAEGDANQYTLNVAELASFAVGAKDNAEYVKGGTNNYFTVFYSAKTKVEYNEKTFSDQFSATQRIAWGDKTTVGDQILNAVKIKTDGSAKIKLWWVGGDKDRNPAIFDASGNVVAKDTTTTVKNSLYISTLEVPEAGVYYIGNIGGSNYFYQVQVLDSADGGEPAARADWTGVAAPVISSAIDNGAGNIVVNVNALVGHDGADELLVSMYDSNGNLVKTKGSVTEKSSHTIEFTPANSGTYTFKAELVRAGEESKKAEDVSCNFVYVLKAPYLSSVTSKGAVDELGTIEILWGGVHEAECYNIYQNGVKIATVQAGYISYTATGLTIGESYSYVVSAVRGAEELKSESLSAKATVDAKQTWGFTVYGPSTNADNNGYVGSLNDDGFVTVYSEGGKGKIQPNSVDGIAFYYTAVPTIYNFTLRARITIDSWTLSNGQEGFGLLVTDRLGTNGDKGNIWNNSYLAGSTKIEYRYNADTNEIINIATQDTTISKYSMKLGIGTIARTGVTKDNLADLEANDQDTIKYQFKTMTDTLEREGADSRIAGTYNIIGNHVGGVAEGTLDETKIITEYIMEIQKNNSGYFISYYDKDGNLIAQKKNYDPEALNQLDENFVYAGFFASRNARATFSDVEFTTILASEDAEREYPPTTYVDPKVTVNSGNVTTSEDYELFLDPNVAGTITVKYRGETVVTKKVIAEQRLKVAIELYDYDENYIEIEFAPDPTQWLGDYVELSTKSTVYTTHTVMYNRGNWHRKTIYISPSVKAHSTTGDGTRENPFDLLTALENAYPGQTLILMEGTYKPNTAITIQRGMNGTADAPIKLIADPEATTRPVIDFQGLYAGFTIGGNYWYFQGFDVTGSLNAQKGIQVSGHYNTLDQIHAYYNGNTGIQICRLKGTDEFEDWPSHNLILNCTSYCNFDGGFEDADGFAAKLTVGEGNVFDGCISFNNADDGWDLYAKVNTGSIGAVTIRNCIAFNNGWVPGYDKTGNGNGFKMGGDSLSGKHVLENSIAFNNLAKGIDSNSCPDIIVKNSISFNNGGANVAFYTNNAVNTDFSANGVISFRTEKLDVAENFKTLGSQDNTKFMNETAYYWDAANGYCANVNGDKITADMFVSLEYNGWSRNADGTINLGGFLELKDTTPAGAQDCKLGGLASYVNVLEADEECSFGRAWYNLDKDAHWHYCECGNKKDVGAHDLIWIIDQPVEGNTPGKKHQECTVCEYKKAAITIYPETPVNPPHEHNYVNGKCECGEADPNYTPDTPVEPTPGGDDGAKLNFFEMIWKAIMDFLRSIFPGLFPTEE